MPHYFCWQKIRLPLGAGIIDNCSPLFSCIYDPHCSHRQLVHILQRFPLKCILCRIFLKKKRKKVESKKGKKERKNEKSNINHKTFVKGLHDCQAHTNNITCSPLSKSVFGWTMDATVTNCHWGLLRGAVWPAAELQHKSKESHITYNMMTKSAVD